MKAFLHACAQIGIQEWVSCSNTLSSPILSAIQQCPIFKSYRINDTAAAASFALGRCQASGRPLALLVEESAHIPSLQAAIEEARKQGRSLLIFITQGLQSSHAQSIGDFEADIRLQLPCTPQELKPLTEAAKAGCPLLIDLQGSVELSQSLEEISLAPAPSAPPFRGSLVELSQMLRFKAQDDLLIILGSLEPCEQEPALWLCQTLRAPVLAEASSGLREALVKQALCQAEDILCQVPPRYILRLGEVPQSPYWHSLEEQKQIAVYSISRLADTGLSRPSCHITGDLEQIAKVIGDIPHLYPNEEQKSLSRQNSAQLEEQLLCCPESQGAILRAFSHYASMADNISLLGQKARQAWQNFAQQNIPTLSLYAPQSAQLNSIATFLAYAENTESAYALIDVEQLIQAQPTTELLPQLSQGLRIIATLTSPQEADISPQIQQMAEQWGASYHCICDEGELDLLDELEENAFLLLEMKA